MLINGKKRIKVSIEKVNQRFSYSDWMTTFYSLSRELHLLISGSRAAIKHAIINSTLYNKFRVITSKIMSDSGVTCNDHSQFFFNNNAINSGYSVTDINLSEINLLSSEVMVVIVVIVHWILFNLITIFCFHEPINAMVKALNFDISPNLNKVNAK